jgi:putative transposase
MPRKGYTPEQIINKLREAEVLIAQGSAISIVCKRLESATTPITVGVKNTAG